MKRFSLSRFACRRKVVTGAYLKARVSNLERERLIMLVVIRTRKVRQSLRKEIGIECRALCSLLREFKRIDISTSEVRNNKMDTATEEEDIDRVHRIGVEDETEDECWLMRACNLKRRDYVSRKKFTARNGHRKRR